MSAFPDHPDSGAFDCLRKIAQAYNCNTCFDDVIEQVRDMEKKGKDGVLYCTCRIDTPCLPCSEGKTEIKIYGACYCGILRALEETKN